MECKGNYEEFQKYEKIINSPIENKIIINYDNNIKKYEGNIINGLYDGKGILYDKSGKMIYQGFFKSGEYEGFGRKYEDNQLIYEGFFSKGKYEGKGTLYKNGNIIFEGNFSDDEYHGPGIFYVNGEKVSKRFYKNGYYSSKGYLVIYENNEEVYSGITYENKPKEGKNLTIYDDEGYLIYKGDFFNFNYHGEGIIYFKNSNDKYSSGIFENNNLINGVLYDINGDITYKGKFINNFPVEGKSIKIYDLYKNLKYIGDISNCKYNGNGKLYKDKFLYYDGTFKDGNFNGFGKIYKKENLYYEGDFINNEIIGKGIIFFNNKKKHIEGNFEFKNKNDKFDFTFSKKYAKGILYDYDGNKLCESEIIDFIPKEGKNLKLYSDEDILIYEGDISDYLYHGKGKMYEKEILYINNKDAKYILKYEGEFKQNIFEGYGKLYEKFYRQLFYEGEFCNGKIKGKGIRFYKSGKKKLEGIFKKNDIFEGKYYNPYGEVIFKGKIVNDIFYNTNFLKIYNDNEFLIYKGQINNIKNNNELHTNLEILKDIILCREKILYHNYIQINLDKAEAVISFISESYGGKTSLIKRFTDNIFLEDIINRSFVPELKFYEYIYNNIKYKVEINNLHGNMRFHYGKIAFLKRSNIIIYVIDSEIDNDINEIYLNDLYKNHPKDYKFIYLVLTKIDISKNPLEPFRKHVQKLIIDGRIYRYFEVSSKTGEGIDSFVSCLKYDIDLSFKLDIQNKQKSDVNSNCKKK